MVTMKLNRLMCVLALMSWNAMAFAHTHLVKSDPADGSTVKVSPQKFVLTFAEPVKVTALTAQREGEAAKKLAPLPSAAAAEVSVPAPQLAPGKYVLSWRAAGDDGHVMAGKITFTVGS
jgi:methionine-rich copper-binding protein CopC